MSKQMPIKNNKDKFITVCSFICSIMIVGLHAFNAGSLPLNSATTFIEAVISHGLFTGAVPVFLFTSGYLFYRNINSVKDCLAKQKKRVVSVVMPFFVWSAFYYAFYAIGNRFLGITMSNPVDISLSGIIEGIFCYKYCYHLWFMWQLILYVIISPLIYWVLSKKKLSVLIWILFAIGGICGVKPLGLNILDGRLNFAVNYFAYYFAGCLMAKNPQILDKIKETITKVPTIVLAIAYSLFGILGGVVFQEYIATFNKRCVVPLIAISLWALIYKICQNHKDIKVPEKVSTMIVYAIHPFVGMIVGTVLGMLALPNLIHYFVWFVITAILSCVTSLIIRLIKPIHWLLSGNR